MINEKEVRRALDIFKTDGELVEIRIFGGKNKEVYSGYYTNHDDIIRDIKAHEDKNMYFVFNGVKDWCYSKAQRDKLVYGGEGTKDTDISYRKFILIDVDCQRGGNKVSSSDEELELARIKANKVRSYLRDIGFSYPVVCLSGSGFHLLYKCSLANTDEHTQLIKNFLEYLSLIFSDEKVEIDKVVFNPARITRLYGTVNHKGYNSKERPHRESKIIRIPTEIKDVDKSLIEKVANMLPQKEKPTYQNNYGKDIFDIDSFISKHNIDVDKEIRLSDGTRKILLKSCPFDPSHLSPDSCIIIRPDNTLCFKCLHNSCSNKGWRDFRQYYEPDCYEKKYQDPYRKNFLPSKESFEIKKETDELGSKWLQTKEIQTVDRDSIISVPSGIKELDASIVGFDLKEITVWSGSNASGKSSILNFVQLNAIQAGFKVAIWSAELPPQQLKAWTVNQSAGRQFVKPSNFANAYYTPKHIVEKIDSWLEGKLFIYNNDYGNKHEQLLADIEEKVKQDDVSVVVIDNLFSMNISSFQGDKYSQQTQLILDIVSMAKKLNIHIHLVAHPRKVTSFLRKVDISGSSDLSNAAHNVLIMHRVNKDFERGMGEFYGQDKVPEYMKYSCVMEIAKNRSMGVVDKLIGLYYETESRRFLNDKFENPIFGWQETYTEQPIQFSDSFSTNYAELYGDYDLFTENPDTLPF